MSLVRYAIVFVVVALGTAFAVAGLNTQVDGTLGSGAQLMVPAMIAAAIEGTQHARQARERATTAALWSFVWQATALATALNVALAYLAGDLAPEFAKLAIAQPFGQQWLILLGLYAGGYLISNRLFFGIGQGNQLSLMRSRDESE